MLFIPYQRRNGIVRPRREPPPPLATQPLPVPVPIPEDPAKKPMKWGEPTWFLFHTLAEKINPEYFSQHRDDVFDIIRSICNTLPCPDCAKHATQYMEKVQFRAIQTKEDLQLMLWNFHNEVNQRKGVALFPFSELKEKYSKGITRNIIHHFIRVHSDKHASFRMLSNEHYRSRIISRLKAWFISNIQHFDD